MLRSQEQLLFIVEPNNGKREKSQRKNKEIKI